jgi:hypothetical protein
MSFDMIFMGCGSSSGVPMAACLMDPRSKCRVCAPMKGPVHPRFQPNARGNPSLLIRVRNPAKLDGDGKNSQQNQKLSRKDEKFVIIDVGKYLSLTRTHTYIPTHSVSVSVSLSNTHIYI